MDDIICLILIFYFDLKTHSEMVNATSTRTVSLKPTLVFDRFYKTDQARSDEGNKERYGNSR
jgi:hypothetical protein